MRRRQEGVIDPLSLIGLGFLVVSLLIGAIAINKQNANYDIRSKAAVCMDPCQSNSDCEANEYCYMPATGCHVCKPKPTSVPTPSCNTGNCYNDCICHNNPPDLCNESCNPSTTPPPSTLPTTTPTPAPACGGLYDPCCGAYPSGSCNSGLYCSNMDGGTCLTNVCTPCTGCTTVSCGGCSLSTEGYRCVCSGTCGSGYANCQGLPDSSCHISTSTPTPTPTTTTYTCTITSGQWCSPEGCSASSGECYGTGSCVPGRSCCKVCPTPTPTRTPTPTPPTTYTCTITSGQWCSPEGCSAFSGECYGTGSCAPGRSCCKPCPIATPTRTPTPTPAPVSCGHEWEACCGSGSCNSGLYCSNIDGGTCMTKVCTAGQKQCSGNSLGFCKADGSGWTYTTCNPYGCDSASKQCQICQPGVVTCSGDTLKTCNPSGTGWDSQTCPTNKTCDANLKICVSKSGTCLDPCTYDTDCGTGNYCYKPAGGCPVCKTKATVCTPGAKQCSGNYLQTCNSFGISWLSQDCGSFGCNNSTKACNPNPSIISQADCDQCLQNNTPSECSGVCQNIGGTITTPLGQQECVPGTKLCSGGNLKICSNSGTWGLTTCSNGCENNSCKKPLLAVGELCNDNSECQSGQCYASGEYYQGTVNQFGLSAGIAPMQSQKRCHNASPQDYQAIQTAVNQGNLAATALAGAIVAPVVAPYLYSYATAALATTPWLQTAASVATLSQLPVSVITCQVYGPDSLPCQYAAMGITSSFFIDPAGTVAALQTSAQTLQSQIGQAWQSTGIPSILNLPNAGEDWGWTLANPSSMGVQTIPQPLQAIQPSTSTFVGNVPSLNWLESMYGVKPTIASQPFLSPTNNYAAGTAPIGESVATFYPVPNADGTFSYYIPTDVAIHEAGHAIAAGGQVPAGNNMLQFYANECTNCAWTVNELLARGYSPTGPQVLNQLTYMQQNVGYYQNAVLNTGGLTNANGSLVTGQQLVNIVNANLENPSLVNYINITDQRFRQTLIQILAAFGGW